jgi:hypothetical protein
VHLYKLSIDPRICRYPLQLTTAPISLCNPNKELRAPSISHVLTLRTLDGTDYQPHQQESKIHPGAEPCQSIWQSVLLLLVGLLYRVLVMVSSYLSGIKQQAQY